MEDIETSLSKKWREIPWHGRLAFNQEIRLCRYCTQSATVGWLPLARWSIYHKSCCMV